MELKLQWQLVRDTSKASFNCTFMELKSHTLRIHV